MKNTDQEKDFSMTIKKILTTSRVRDLILLILNKIILSISYKELSKDLNNNPIFNKVNPKAHKTELPEMADGFLLKKMKIPLFKLNFSNLFMTGINNNKFKKI
jgi:hypothetical protein